MSIQNVLSRVLLFTKLNYHINSPVYSCYLKDVYICFVKKEAPMDYNLLFEKYKELQLEGRYIHLETIIPILEKYKLKNKIAVIGTSVLDQPIYSYEFGSGPMKILMWSQMHGNESTTTKALFDLFNFLDSEDPMVDLWREKFTFLIIPMLNPDGAKLYTRENANMVDLNRDFINLSQPESRLLLKIFNDFKPNYCYNLHDQRTIFAAGKTNIPATVSFLAPSFDEARSVNEVRQKAMVLIAAMNKELQNHIPGQVGRFDDGFNRNCAGDTFQQLGVPTILFESGHFPNDYTREITRKFIFMSLFCGLKILNENDIVNNIIDDYLNIPQNNIGFYDFVYRNVKINYDNSELITNFAAQFKEELIEGQLVFNAYISSIGDLEGYFGHVEYDAKGALYQDEKGSFPKIDEKANFTLGKTNKFVNGLLKK